MFTHSGRKRNSKHNLQIASLLSFVAGLVNVAGFLAVSRLTTNVTGHFALFVDEANKLNFWSGAVYFLYILFFFLGSFCSNTLVEFLSRRGSSQVYFIPAAIESIILLSIGFFGSDMIFSHPNVIACALLFAMGLQNSLVTRISKATVRTTHLTGLFTDLGIEFSQLLFYRRLEDRYKLIASIQLRLTIIGFFFVGGIIGGMFYPRFRLGVLVLASLSLIAGMLYDNLRLRVLLVRRRFR